MPGNTVSVYALLSHTGFFWYECKEVWIEGLRSYFLDWWNCLDMMVLSMYLASFALRVLIMLKGYFLCHDQSGTEACVYFTETGGEIISDYSSGRNAGGHKSSILNWSDWLWGTVLQFVRTGTKKTPS